MSRHDARSVLKWTPSTIVSVVSTRVPGPLSQTAASSPTERMSLNPPSPLTLGAAPALAAIVRAITSMVPVSPISARRMMPPIIWAASRLPQRSLSQRSVNCSDFVGHGQLLSRPVREPPSQSSPSGGRGLGLLLKSEQLQRSVYNVAVWDSTPSWGERVEDG